MSTQIFDKLINKPNQLYNTNQDSSLRSNPKYLQPWNQNTNNTQNNRINSTSPGHNTSYIKSISNINTNNIQTTQEDMHSSRQLKDRRNSLITSDNDKKSKPKIQCNFVFRPLDKDSFTQNMGSLTESTLEGPLLAQNIPLTKAVKMPHASKLANEDMNFKIRNKDTGEVYDLRDLPDTRDFAEVKNSLSLKKTTQAWQDWWMERKKLDQELLNYSRYGNYEACMKLLGRMKGDLKADVNCKCENDWTPLHFACLNGNIELVNLLIYYGANVDAETSLKFTPLILASQKGFEDIVSLLITSGSDINCQDIYKNTPLHYAAQNGHKHLVQVLLQRPSINLTMRNNENKSAYELTTNKEIKDLIDIFLTEKSLLNSKFMQKVPIHVIQSDQVKLMFDGFQNDPLNKYSQYAQASTIANTTNAYSTNNLHYMNHQSKLYNQNQTFQTNNTPNPSCNFSRMHYADQSLMKNNPYDHHPNMQNVSDYANLVSVANPDETSLSSSNLNMSYCESDISNSIAGGGLEGENEKVGPHSFSIHGLIGKGSFGEVYLVQKKDSKTAYAMKVLEKSRIMRNNLVKYALTERNVLSLTNHPFIVKLNYAFQTHDKLFLILDYCPGGDLSEHLKQETKFTEERAKIYISEILLALEDLHRRDIIFRDLKPDNIVLDSEGHALLTDFGLSKEGVLDHSQGARSFCGTVAYLAPEMLKQVGHGKAVDWYLLGVAFYEMLVGKPPFYASNREQLFENIEKAPLTIPSDLSEPAKSLLQGLLQRNPLKRLGSGKGDAEEIKKHKFFESINWADVYSKKLRPPIPELKRRENMRLRFNVFDCSFPVNTSDKHYIDGWSFVAAEEKKNQNENISRHHGHSHGQ